MRVYLDQTLKWLKRGIDFAFDITDVVFSVFLGGLSYYVLTIGLLHLNKEQSAAAAGALFSGAALLFGNWINRWSTARRASEEAARIQDAKLQEAINIQEERLEKLKLMLAGEFQMLSLSLTDALVILDAAVTTKRTGGYLSATDWTRYLPPLAVLIIDSSNFELSALDHESLAALMGLRQNLWVTRREFNDLSMQSDPHVTSVWKVQQGVRHTMKSLTDAIHKIYPDFRSNLPDSPNTLLTEWLNGKLAESVASDPGLGPDVKDVPIGLQSGAAYPADDGPLQSVQLRQVKNAAALSPTKRSALTSLLDVGTASSRSSSPSLDR